MSRKRRERKYRDQGGLCHWCKCPMEMDSLNQNGNPNSLYATFEHLVRKSEGGLGRPNNVVLAHASCNRKRDTPRFEEHVEGMRAAFVCGAPQFARDS